MKKSVQKSFLATLVFLFSSATLAECLAYRQFQDLRSEETRLIKDYEDATMVSYSADIDEVHFNAKISKEENDHLLIVTEGPEYLKGTTVRGAFNQRGILRGAWVQGANIYRLSCSQTSM